MPGLDLGKLKEAAETLKKRGSGSQNWITLSKIEAPLDFRILDPLASMGGIYYQEVPLWWVNGVRLISPRMLDASTKDVIDDVLTKAKSEARTDKTLAKLLNAKDDKTKIAKIQFKYDYWVPGLQFAWETDKTAELTGIFLPGGGGYDVELIRKFIVDGRVKVLQANITALKAINTLLTSRGGANMLDPVKGKNIQLQKSGEGRDTKYAVVPMEEMPMPADFYTPEHFTDPFEIAQALMMTDEYMIAVIEKYLYGDVEIPNEDDSYRFPEIREKLKDKTKEDDSAPAAPSRRRGGAAPAQAAPAPTRGRAAGPVSGTAAHDDLATAAPPVPAVPVVPARTPRGAGRPAAGASRGGGKRNLANDLIEGGK